MRRSRPLFRRVHAGHVVAACGIAALAAAALPSTGSASLGLPGILSGNPTSTQSLVPDLLAPVTALAPGLLGPITSKLPGLLNPVTSLVPELPPISLPAPLPAILGGTGLTPGTGTAATPAVSVPSAAGPAGAGRHSSPAAVARPLGTNSSVAFAGTVTAVAPLLGAPAAAELHLVPAPAESLGVMPGLSFGGAPYLWPLFLLLDAVMAAAAVYVVRRTWSSAVD